MFTPKLVVPWEGNVAAEAVLGLRWQWRQWDGDTTPVAAAKKEIHPKNNCALSLLLLAYSAVCKVALVTFADLFALILGCRPAWCLQCWSYSLTGMWDGPPRCQMSCTINPLPGVKAWLPFLSHFSIFGGMRDSCVTPA